MMRLEQILEQVRTYDPQANLQLIEQAYALAERVHQGQKRASGEPYLIHPLEVAFILSQMKLDAASIVAGLLHDTVEDTGLELSKIEQDFGEEIAKLVDGVTKLSKIKFSSTEEKQAQNFRKMIVAMAADIRVILIKLADRLNNMRTLSHLSEEKQRKIARETQDIYAPLANRLGIQWMKVELEDLCLKYLKPEIYQAIARSAQQQQNRRETYMAKVQGIVEGKLREYEIPHVISGRIKHIYSIYRKMVSQNISFDQVHDILAFRIIVDTIRQCYEALGMLHELWKPVPGRFKDYIAMPKVNNYQSLHTTEVCLEGQHVEFQIRTREMHAIAESGIAAHWNYKENGSISREDREKFQWLRELIELQSDLKDPAEFLDTVKLDLFATDVYVFTPNGKLTELPFGSTPVDFAYRIHTDVGNQCVGAKVDDKIVPLDYRLKSGDTVTILTRANSRPSRDWLKFVKSSRARAKIRQEIKEDQRDKSIQLGRDFLSREIERLGYRPSKYLQSEELLKVAREAFHLHSIESLEAQIGYGKITAHHVVAKLFPEKAKAEIDEQRNAESKSILSEIFKSARRKNRSGIKVGGHQDILVTLGKCCSPLPGDSITGFISRGRGVVVHTTGCEKALSNDPERRVEVSWDYGAEVTHQARVKTVTADRPGMLADITKKISSLDVNISEANIRTSSDQKAINIFTLDIVDREQLEQVVRVLEGIKGVISVTRLKS